MAISRVAGALLAGFGADVFGSRVTLGAVAAVTAMSGLAFALPRHKTRTNLKADDL